MERDSHTKWRIAMAQFYEIWLLFIRAECILRFHLQTIMEAESGLASIKRQECLHLVWSFLEKILSGNEEIFN